MKYLKAIFFTYIFLVTTFLIAPDGVRAEFARIAMTAWVGTLSQGSDGGNIQFGTSGTGVFGPGGAGDIIYFGQTGADGSDDARAAIAGGATAAPGRGGSLTAYGNDYGSPNAGAVNVQTGDAVNSTLRLTLNHSGATVQVRDPSDVTKLTINATGQLTSQGTADLGWSVVDQADNQACNTGCTSACVFGIDNATGTAVTNLVSCAATTADLCVCAGAS